MPAPNDATSYRRLAYGARAFAVVVALIPGVADERSFGILGVTVLALTWVAVSVLEHYLRNVTAGIVVDSVAVGIICGASLGHTTSSCGPMKSSLPPWYISGSS